MKLTDEQKDDIVIRTLVIIMIGMLLLCIVSTISTVLLVCILKNNNIETMQDNRTVNPQNIINIEDIVVNLSISYMVSNGTNGGTYIFNMNSNLIEYGQDQDTLNDSIQYFAFSGNLKFLGFDFESEDSICKINHASIELNTSLVNNIYDYSYLFGINFNAKGIGKETFLVFEGDDKLNSEINFVYSDMVLSNDYIELGAILILITH